MEEIMDNSPATRKPSHQAPTQRESLGVILILPKELETNKQLFEMQ